MRFVHRYEQQSIPEWQNCYINYRFFKSLIHLIRDCIKQKQQMQYLKGPQYNKNKTSDTLYLRTIKMCYATKENDEEELKKKLEMIQKRFVDVAEKSEDMFLKMLEREIKLMLQFVGWKEKQIENKFQKGRVCMSIIANNTKKRKSILKPFFQYLFVESYKLAMMINLNVEIQRRLLDKHALYVDKVFTTPQPTVSTETNLQRTNSLCRKIQKFYTHEASHRTSWQDRYRLKQLIKINPKNDQELLLIGLMTGFAIATAIFLGVILHQANKQLQTDPIFNKDFPKWRGIAFVILYIWGLGINIYVYEKYNISHRVVLENNYTIYPTSVRIFRFASFFTLLYVVFFSLYALQISDVIQLGRLPAQLLSIFVWIPFLACMLNPFPLIYYKARGYTIMLLFKCILSIFVVEVTFPVIWGTDQLVSLFVPFQDLVSTICYYSTMTIKQSGQQVLQSTDCKTPAATSTFVFSIVVYMLRMIQCLKVGFCHSGYWKKTEFLNSIKYGLSLLTAILSHVYKDNQNYSILPVWIVFASLTTIATFLWDVRNDWDLLHWKSSNFLLRDKLCYNKNFYYISIVINFLLRSTWVLYISPNISSSFLKSTQLFVLIFGFVEIYRRCIWNMFRVQVEHLRNCQQLRALPKQFQRLQKQIDKIIQSNQNQAQAASIQRLVDNENVQSSSQGKTATDFYHTEYKRLVEQSHKKQQQEKEQSKFIHGQDQQNKDLLYFLYRNLY